MEERAPNRGGVGLARRVGGATGLALVFVAATLVTSARPASAHTASDPQPTNYRTSLESISPQIPGVTVRVVDLGNKIQVTNRAARDLIVFGYNLEPYLRVGPRGLYENLRSPATYQHRTRTITTDVPAIARGAGASTPPQWHRVSGSRSASWHDHRIHYMGTSPPVAVQRDPGVVHTIDPRWTVVFRYDARAVTVQGRLDWVPGPSAWPWLLLLLSLFALGGAVVQSRRRALSIAAVVMLVGVDLAHAVSAEIARSGTLATKIIQFVADDFVSVIVWIAAAFTVWGLWRRKFEARYGMLLVGAMVGLVSGLTDLAYFWKSQLPTVGPAALARVEIAIAFGLGLGIAAGALVGLRRSVPDRHSRRVRDPRWLERLVAGLDDNEVAIECRRLDAAEVIPAALTEAAERLAPIAGELGSEGLVFVVLAEDEIGSHVWSLTAAAIGGHGLQVQRARPAPARFEVRVTFPALLSLLGGRLTLEEALAGGRLDVDGDRAFLAAIAPRLTSAVSV